MNIGMILEMAASGGEMAASGGDRPAVTADGRSLTASGLLRLAHAAASRFQRYPAVLYLGANHLAYPGALVLGASDLDALLARGDDPPETPRAWGRATPQTPLGTASRCCCTPAGRPPSPRRRCCGTGI